MAKKIIMDEGYEKELADAVKYAKQVRKEAQKKKKTGTGTTAKKKTFKRTSK